MKAEILGHDIKWRMDDEDIDSMDPETAEHIEDSINKGYTQGQIVQDDSTGWWEIVNWQDIALELYNAVKHQKDAQKPDGKMIDKAIERFDKSWD